MINYHLIQYPSKSNSDKLLHNRLSNDNLSYRNIHPRLKYLYITLDNQNLDNQKKRKNKIIFPNFNLSKKTKHSFFLSSLRKSRFTPIDDFPEFFFFFPSLARETGRRRRKRGLVVTQSRKSRGRSTPVCCSPAGFDQPCRLPIKPAERIVTRQRN